MGDCANHLKADLHLRALEEEPRVQLDGALGVGQQVDDLLAIPLPIVRATTVREC